jgi:toxin-antitoxin system PIN domain toxin
MIVPDANLLIYAYDATSPHHDAARDWWEGALSGSEPVGLPWIVILAFTRLMTHPTVSENPMTVGQAREAVEAWLACDHVRLLSVDPDTIDVFFAMLAEAGMGGNLTTDALIAATASDHGGCVYTNDRDFDRFADVAWRNPLQ